MEVFYVYREDRREWVKNRLSWRNRADSKNDAVISWRKDGVSFWSPSIHNSIADMADVQNRWTIIALDDLHEIHVQISLGIIPAWVAEVCEPLENVFYYVIVGRE